MTVRNKAVLKKNVEFQTDVPIETQEAVRQLAEMDSVVRDFFRCIFETEREHWNKNLKNMKKTGLAKMGVSVSLPALIQASERMEKLGILKLEKSESGYKDQIKFKMPPKKLAAAALGVSPPEVVRHTAPIKPDLRQTLIASSHASLRRQILEDPNIPAESKIELLRKLET